MNSPIRAGWPLALGLLCTPTVLAEDATDSAAPTRPAGTSTRPTLADEETPKRPRLSDLSHAVSRDVAWYVNPVRHALPNGFLPQGTRVQVLSTHGSYARVWTEDGVVFAGYVARSELRELAPPDDSR